MSHGSHHPISKFPSSVPMQNLTDEGLLLKAKRDAENRPVMGGIPLIAKLGQGGMGAVYYGIHPRLNLEVAVKVLPFHLADANPDLIRRFFGEAQIAARVQSEHIVRVLDVNEETGVYYLVMEYVKGMSAAGVLKALQRGEFVSDVSPANTSAASGGVKALPTAAALAIVIGAARGLSAAHQSGVIHRDIKPDNIMIPRGQRTDPLVDPPLALERAKLADLGLAKIDDGSTMGTMSQMAMGTPGYMAPEQIRDAKRASKQSDVFSLGATLYALLAGRMAFAGSGVGDILIKTVSSPHDPLVAIRPDVPSAICDLIDRCLSKDPNERYADGAALLDALLLAQSGGSIPAVSSRAPAAGMTPSTRGYAGSATPAPGPVRGPGQGVGSGSAPAPGQFAKSPTTLGPAAEHFATPVPAKPARSAAGLIIAGIVLLLLGLGGGGAALYWFGVVVPTRAEYLGGVQVGRDKFAAAKADFGAGKITEEAYLQRLKEAELPVSAALDKVPDGPEGEETLRAIRAEGDQVRRHQDDMQTQTEAQFHAAYNQAMLKEASAKAATDFDAGMTLLRQAADLYTKAHELRPQESGPAEGQARTQKVLAEYAQRTDQTLTKLVADAEALERAAQGESDLAKQRQLWLDAGAVLEKLRALAPEHPALAPGVVRVKAGLDDIKAREDGEVNMLVLAAQVAADRGAVAKDPDRAMEDWTAAVNGFEKALALKPKDAGIKTKRDAAVKQQEQINAYFAQIKEAQAQALRYYRAHTIPELKLTAAACIKACESALALRADDTTRGMVAASKNFPDEIAACEAARKQSDAGDTGLAMDRYTKLTQAEPNLAFAWYSLGHLQLDQETADETTTADNRDRISANFAAATRIDPAYAEAWYAWGRMLEHAEPEVPAEPGDGEAEADSFIAGRHAQVKYAQAAKSDPQMVEAWLASGRLLYDASTFGSASFALRKVVALDPKNRQAWILLGDTLNDESAYNLAAEQYAKAAALDSTDATVWRKWGDALQSAGRLEEALAPLQKAVALNPDQKDWANQLANLTSAVANRNQLVETCNRMKALAEVKAISIAQIVEWIEALRELQRYREATACARTYATDAAESAPVWDAWATLLSMQNDYEGGLEKEKKACALDDANQIYEEALTQHQASIDTEKETRGRFAGYTKTLEADPHDVTTLYNWANDLCTLNRDDESLLKVKRGLEIDPEDSSLLELQDTLAERALVRTHAPK